MRKPAVILLIVACLGAGLLPAALAATETPSPTPSPTRTPVALSDDFGYRLQDEAFQWVEISSTGNLVGSWTGTTDDGYTSITLPWNMLFYGNWVKNVKLHTNGYLQFEQALISFNNLCLDHPDAPLNMIAPLWQDFNPSIGGRIYWQIQGAAGNRRAIFEWQDVERYDGGGSATFEVILNEADHSIQMLYLDVAGVAQGAMASVGIRSAQDCPDHNELPYSCMRRSLADGLALRLSYPADPPACGTLTFTHSPTSTHSPTRTSSPTATPSATPSSTATPSATPTATASASPTLPASATYTASPSFSPSPSATATASGTPSPSASASATASPSPTASSTAPESPTAPPSATPTPTQSPSSTPSPTASPEPFALGTSSPTPPGPSPTRTASPQPIILGGLDGVFGAQPQEPGRLSYVYPQPAQCPEGLRVALRTDQAAGLRISVLTLRGNRILEIRGQAAAAGVHSFALDCGRLEHGLSYVLAEIHNTDGTKQRLKPYLFAVVKP